MSERLFAIGDIHGCFNPFCELLEQKIRFRKGDRLVLLGDYIDRGYQTREVIDYIIGLQESGYDVIPLKGNHESMMLDSMDDEQMLSNWFLNGGYETLYSFGVDSLNDLNIKYLHFFRNLPSYYIQDRFMFVHAGFNDEISDPLADQFEMIWSRKENYSNPFFNDKIIVHGHTPVSLTVCREALLSRNRVINIDTGCVYDELGGLGHLTAIELFSRELYSV